MPEQWRKIPGFLGMYEVSNLGNVRTYRVRGKIDKFSSIPKLMVPRIKHKYRQIGLRLGDRRCWRPIGSLILEAFVGPRPPKHQACHWDGNHANDTLGNLRWGTAKENAADSIRLGVLIGHKAGIKHHNARLTDDDIRCIRAEPQFRGVAQMLARAFDMSARQVRDIRAGLYWGHVEQFR